MDGGEERDKDFWKSLLYSKTDIVTQAMWTLRIEDSGLPLIVICSLGFLCYSYQFRE